MRFLLSTLLLTATLQMHAQDTFVEEFQQKWENAATYTLEVAEKMPEEFYDFKPTEDQMSFAEQVLHLLRNMTWLSTDYLTEETYEVDWKGAYSKAEILELIKETYAFAGKAADGLSAKELETKVEFFAGPMSKRQILTLMNDHSTHHRGQLLVYLRLKNVKPPRYRGW